MSAWKLGQTAVYALLYEYIQLANTLCTFQKCFASAVCLRRCLVKLWPEVWLESNQTSRHLQLPLTIYPDWISRYLVEQMSRYTKQLLSSFDLARYSDKLGLAESTLRHQISIWSGYLLGLFRYLVFFAIRKTISSI